MAVSTRLLAMLGEIAALAVRTGQRDAPLAIHQGILAARPHDGRAQRGWAFALISAGRYAEAASELQDTVLPGEPEDVHARCLFAYALYKSGRTAAAELLLRDCLEAPDADCRELARSCLGSV